MQAIKFWQLMAACLAALVFSSLGGCKGQRTPPSPEAPSSSKKQDEASTSTQPVSSVRVMTTVPWFTLRAQDGGIFGYKELNGKVWIATFIFTRCPLTCPTQTKAMDQLQRQFSSDEFRFVSITVDPEFDTQEVLLEYAERAGANSQRWKFLTGQKELIWNLCRDGFKLPVSPSSDNGTPISHSPNLILVDRARRIRGYYDATDPKAIARLKQDIEFVRQDPPGPIYEHQLEFDQSQPGPDIYWPDEIRDVTWMKERAQKQFGTVGDFKVFYEFQFTDRLPQSNITFVNRVVDDAAKNYKAAHYDHGNGVAVADVNGDGLLDIYFVNQLGANQLCKNLGGGKFEDITDASGVAVADRIGVTASFADTDNDGDPDLYVTTVRGGNLLFENDGKGKFHDVSAAAGLDYNGHSSAGVFFDYDHDGLLDLFLANPGVYTTDEVGEGDYYIAFPDAFSGHLFPNRSERSILYRNLGDNRFIDVSDETGLVDESWTGAASPIDGNGDGWPDLYVVNMQGHDEYYENVNGQSFVNKSRRLFPKTSWGAMDVKSLDYNNDGLPDLFITDMHTDMVDGYYRLRRFWHAEKMKMTESFPARQLATDLNHVQGNAFFVNTGKKERGRFQEISDQIGTENYWPWGLSIGDLNADGFEDVFVTASMNYQFRYGVNSVLLNNRGEKFLDSEFILGVEPRRDGRTCVPWFKLDCGGADRDHVFCEGRNDLVGFYGAIGTRSSVIFDLDEDGDLDIVTNDFHSEPMVLISNLSEKKPDLRFLKIQLIGSKSNRSGIGARVRVIANGQTYTKVNDGQSGYLSQSDFPLYFGLDEATEIDEVEVTWPSEGAGAQVISGPIPTNQVLQVQEP